MFISIVLIIVGFILLIKGADFLVDGSSNIAKKFHIPEIIIGLTIISIGTSMPELFVSTTSALEGHTDMAIGNVLGSNICNLFLILGLSAMIQSIELKRETRLIEIPITLVITIIFMVICNIENNITKAEGIVLILIFILFIIYTIIMAFKGEQFDKEDSIEEKEVKEKQKTSTIKDLTYIVLGIIALKIGGDLAVDNAVKVAQIFNLSEKIISVTILAVGTSLPELVTSVSAAIKGKSDIAIGNILGSCIFNILLIIGVSAVIKPIIYNVSYNKDLIILIIGTLILALFPIIPPKNKMSKINGLIYLLLYIGYMISLFVI